VKGDWCWRVVSVFNFLRLENQEMTRSRGRTYNDDEMVQLIAEGGLSQAAIAERLGVHLNTVWTITHGLSRPDLQGRINNVIRSLRKEARRQGARRLKAAVDKHFDVGLASDKGVARRCREFLINLFIDDDEADSDNVEEKRKSRSIFGNLADLSPDLKNKVIEELGGPSDDIIFGGDRSEN
jgi:transposase-like protein